MIRATEHPDARPSAAEANVTADAEQP